jgi:hypothetical protein
MPFAFGYLLKDSHLQAGKRKGVSELYRPATPYSFDFKNI